jgi:hypothetical protein
MKTLHDFWHRPGSKKGDSRAVDSEAAKQLKEASAPKKRVRGKKGEADVPREEERGAKAAKRTKGARRKKKDDEDDDEDEDAVGDDAGAVPSPSSQMEAQIAVLPDERGGLYGALVWRDFGTLTR